MKINRHFRRFEFKYILDKNICDLLIPDIMSYMSWDAYVQKKEYYYCNSLYLDNHQRKSYFEKIDGYLNRKKVRIRSYNRGFSKDEKLFFELKRKSGEIVLKDREILSPKDYSSFLEDPFSLLDLDGVNNEFLNEFVWECVNYQMKPSMLVSYKRKPFFYNFDKSLRLTFDYDLEFALPAGRKDFQAPYAPLLEDYVIMEIKFSGALPGWVSNIINKYRLEKSQACKYCLGMDLFHGEPQYA